MKLIKKYKSVIIIIIIVLAIIGIYMYKTMYLDVKNQNSNMENESNVRVHEYKLYNFNLEGCEACKSMLPIYNESKTTYGDKLDFELVDVTENPDLSNKYVINLVPTFLIVDKDGNVIKRKIGSMSKEDFFEFIESVVNK